MDPKNNEIENSSDSIATFGGGCFWCLDAVFIRLNGVSKVLSGYSGGHVKNPSYREVCAKKTGHAEVIQIYFDEAIISYSELLKVFWTTHDPTKKDRQGNDVGPQYRSIILFHNATQELEAKKSLEGIANHIWSDPVVTEIVPFQVFYEAESEHQGFYDLNSTYPYCQYIINPKVQKLKNSFSSLLKPET